MNLLLLERSPGTGSRRRWPARTGMVSPVHRFSSSSGDDGRGGAAWMERMTQSGFVQVVFERALGWDDEDEG
jgi:hypothetical protein